MIALLLAFAQVAQPSAPPPPSAAAVALAHLAAARPVSTATTHEIEQAIVQRLFYTYPRRGPGCDPQVPACRATAERIAREAAPAELAARRELYEQWLAVILDATMTPDDIAAATRFAQTPAGRSFAGALLLLSAPGNMSAALQQRLAQVMSAPRGYGRDGPLFDRFYDATAKLPRRALPIAPPAPLQPSPSASKP